MMGRRTDKRETDIPERIPKHKLSPRTITFITFMILFFLTTGYLTYYSNVVYLRKLPRTETVMPEWTGEYHNGREVYLVPEESVHEKAMGRYIVYTARLISDELGERYRVEEVYVYVLGKADDGRMIVSGIVWEEAVITQGYEGMKKGDAVLKSL